MAGRAIMVAVWQREVRTKPKCSKGTAGVVLATSGEPVLLYTRPRTLGEAVVASGVAGTEAELLRRERKLDGSVRRDA